jgi:hypothetical protein
MNASARNKQNNEATKRVVESSNAGLVLTGRKLGIRHPSTDASIDGEHGRLVALALDTNAVSACCQ